MTLGESGLGWREQIDRGYQQATAGEHVDGRPRWLEPEPASGSAEDGADLKPKRAIASNDARDLVPSLDDRE